MDARKWTRRLLATALCAAIVSPVIGVSSASAQRVWGRQDRRAGDDRYGRRVPRGYQEPAFARGYSDGYARGADDGRDRDRYDPVRAREYRDGDRGYFREYGPRDAYKNNYRTGFRQGYEDGYRDNRR